MKRYQIFISSTYEDLKDERLAVLDALLAMDCIPAGMELFTAASKQTFEVIKKVIDESDYYILIIAGRYGSIAEGGLSYTEEEFDYAVSKSMPVLAFIHDRPSTLPAEYTDPENQAKLDAFKKKVRSSRLTKSWRTIDKLVRDVAESLRKEISDNPQLGWERSHQKEDSAILYRRIADNFSEIETLQARNTRLEEDSKQLRRRYEAEAASLKSELAQSQGKVKNYAELQKNSGELSQRVEALAKALNQLRAEQELNQKTIQKYKVDTVSLKKELAQSQSKANNYEAANQELIALKKKTTDLEQEINRLRSELSNAKTSAPSAPSPSKQKNPSPSVSPQKKDNPAEEGGPKPFWLDFRFDDSDASRSALDADTPAPKGEVYFANPTRPLRPLPPPSATTGNASLDRLFKDYDFNGDLLVKKAP